MKFIDARDKLFSIVADLPHPIVWTDTVASLPDTEEVWLRVSVQHFNGGQSSLSCENGTRRWVRQGTMFVQVFEPVANARNDIYNVAQTVVDKLQGFRDDNLWLRNARISEASGQGNFSQINVSVTFEYDDYGNL